jgi:hypothetical protein
LPKCHPFDPCPYMVYYLWNSGDIYEQAGNSGGNSGDAILISTGSWGKPRVSGTLSRQGLIWYIVIGGIVPALAIFGIFFTAGREKAGCHAHACVGMSLGNNRHPTPTAIPKSCGLEAATQAYL